MATSASISKNQLIGVQFLCLLLFVSSSSARTSNMPISQLPFPVKYPTRDTGPKFVIPTTTFTEDDEYESDLLSSLNTANTTQNEEVADVVETVTESTTTIISTEEITQEIEATLATSLQECNRDGYMMVSYRTISLFLIIIASIFLMIAVLTVITYVVQKKKKLRPRHGEYKLTTMRDLPETLKVTGSEKPEDMY